MMAIFKFSVSISRSGKQKNYFKQIKLGTSVIPLFRVILSGKYIFDIIFTIIILTMFIYNNYF